MKAIYTELHRSHEPQFFLVRGVVSARPSSPSAPTGCWPGSKQASTSWSRPRVRAGAAGARSQSGISELSRRGMGRLVGVWRRRARDDCQRASGRHAATYPTHIVGRLGWHTADTGCPIGPGTLAAACAATDVAATAAQMVLDGEDAVYALCRPPGHHAFRDVAGGFCFLNNSAVAAAHLRLKHERVAILDVDVHHGNGTQGIFYERPDVLTVSIHADPAFYYPYVWGYAHERGAGAGLGANLNIPVAARHRG